MGKLNERYSEIAKDAMKVVIPLMGEIKGWSCDDNAAALTKVIINSMSLVGDILDAMDDSIEKQEEMMKIIKEQNEMIESLAKEVKTLKSKKE